MKKNYFLTFFFVFYFIKSIFGQLPPDIELAGDEIIYSKNQQQIFVSGNVVLGYQNYLIHADRFILDVEREFVHFPSQFQLIRIARFQS